MTSAETFDTNAAPVHERSTRHTLPRPIDVGDLVRVGRAYDGGYVISARAIERSRVLIGLGINEDWSFEADFLERSRDCALVAVDGSVSAERFARLGHGHALSALRSLVGSSEVPASQWRAAREFKRIARAFAEFFADPRHVHIERMIGGDAYDGSLTWPELVRLVETRFGEATGWFLKMDIEGHEYRVLPQVVAHADRITGIAVEFHDCDLHWDRLQQILATLAPHFELVHAHGNNCGPLIAGSTMPRVLELSFLHRSLLTASERDRENPNAYPLSGLDMPNNRDLPDPPVPFHSRHRPIAR